MTIANNRVTESREQLAYLDPNKLEALCNVLVEELGEGSNSLEKDAMKLLSDGDYTGAKQKCLLDPCNPFLAAVSCIASAYRSPMVADSVLRDAARHTADVVRRDTTARIGSMFSAILEN